MNLDTFFQVYKGRPSSKKASVHYSNVRMDKAKQQVSLKPVTIEQIIYHINELLSWIGIETCTYPKFAVKDIDYKRIQEEYHLDDERDIIWLKFTTDGFLGVVATSHDINFDMPSSKDGYHCKHEKSNRWKYNTSGILVHSVNKKWDETFVLIFPLQNIPSKYTRHNIEVAIGNYLIFKQVPIIDFYSHNY